MIYGGLLKPLSSNGGLGLLRGSIDRVMVRSELGSKGNSSGQDC